MIRAIDIARPRLIALRLAKGGYRLDEHGELEKRCARCREYWPADEEFFFAGRGYADGLHCYCKACYLEKRWPNARSGTVHFQHRKEIHVQGTAPVL